MHVEAKKVFEFAMFIRQHPDKSLSASDHEYVKIHINDVDSLSHCALNYAIRTNDLKTCTVLLEWGADPNVVDHIGRSLLHICACNHHSALIRGDILYGPHMIIDLLMKYGINPDIVDSAGTPALSYALLNGHICCVPFFIRNAKLDDGATIYMPEANQYSPSILLSKRYLPPSFRKKVTIKCLNELWRLDEHEYTSSVQWLPKEILEDVCDLVEVVCDTQYV
jgi:ankyrin repeat protein